MFILKEMAWLYVIPPKYAPDELAHYGYLETLYTEQRLPVLGQSLFDQHVELNNSGDMPQPEPIYQVNWIAQHPPLYYALLIPVFRFLPPGDVAFNIMFLRLISIFMAAATLYVIFKTIKKILHESGILPAAVTVAVAFLPTFSYISATVNNDNLLILLSALLVYLLVEKGAQQAEKQNPRDMNRSVKIGVVLALLALTKMTALPLFFVVLIALAYEFFKGGAARKKEAAVSALVIFGLPLLLAGWWYFGNYLALGTFFPTLTDAVKVYPQILSQFPALVLSFPEIAPNAGVKMGLYDFFIGNLFFFEYYKNFWGSFGPLTLLTKWQYFGIFVFTIAGLGGHIKNILFRGADRKKHPGRLRDFLASGQGILFFVFLILMAPLTWKIYEISASRGFMGAMQGRYLLPAAPALFYMLFRGWEHLSGKRYFEKIAVALMILLILNDAVSLFYIVIPTFY